VTKNFAKDVYDPFQQDKGIKSCDDYPGSDYDQVCIQYIFLLLFKRHLHKHILQKNYNPLNGENVSKEIDRIFDCSLSFLMPGRRLFSVHRRKCFEGNGSNFRLLAPILEARPSTQGVPPR
jgi:hypothetical protein